MKTITTEMIDKFRKNYESDSKALTLTGAMARSEIADLAYIPMNAAKLNGEFSVEVKTRGITAQRKSGRCWMFAALNILREIIAEKINVESFELSQNFESFYDKLEKSNNFLQSVIDSAHLEMTERQIEYYMWGVSDGGYWDMAKDLIKKYGVVPKSAMPETYQSEHTEKFNKLMNSLLKKDAAELRRLVREGKDAEARKEEMLSEIFKAQCIAFGEPVDKFDFDYKDKDGTYHSERGMTPKEFYEKFVGADLDEYITVTNLPTPGKPMNMYFKFHYLGSMVEGDVYNLNLTMDEVKQLCIAQLKDGVPVWFGCDSGAYGDRKTGVWDPDSLDFEGLLGGVDLDMTKSDRLQYLDSGATHAMILVGVNFDENGTPNRWKIENSWGEDVGKKGYFVCSNKYFDEFVYEAIINKKHLSENQRKLLEKEPVVIEPWLVEII